MAKKIQAIAPLLAERLLKFNADIEIHERDIQLMKAQSLFFDQLDPLYSSWFCPINIKLSENKIKLILNDHATYLFASSLGVMKALNLSLDRLIFPIHLELETTNLSFNSVDKDGFLSEVEIKELDQYNYHHTIIAIKPDEIELGIMVWKNNIKNIGNRIYIQMGVKNITTSAFQDNAWISIFGQEFDDYFEYFKSDLEKGRYLGDEYYCEELVIEFDSKKKMQFG